MSETILMSNVLHIVAEASESWTDSELADLLDGRAMLKIIPKSIESKKKVNSKGDLLNDTQVGTVIAELRQSSSRDQVTDKLDTAQFTRRHLEQLSRSLDLPVAKYDSVDALKRNIAEELVGSSLNSKAIRGLERTS